mmetsp:Transcript_99496/g.287214  ORF Transcript_99496/g.287214 Transcript_99496/m.287214 type:complete len:212 (+) Transcript_99496:334-969(+)
MSSTSTCSFIPPLSSGTVTSPCPWSSSSSRTRHGTTSSSWFGASRGAAPSGGGPSRSSSALSTQTRTRRRRCGPKFRTLSATPRRAPPQCRRAGCWTHTRSPSASRASCLRRSCRRSSKSGQLWTSWMKMWRSTTLAPQIGGDASSCIAVRKSRISSRPISRGRAGPSRCTSPAHGLGASGRRRMCGWRSRGRSTSRRTRMWTSCLTASAR